MSVAEGLRRWVCEVRLVMGKGSHSTSGSSTDHREAAVRLCLLGWVGGGDHQLRLAGLSLVNYYLSHTPIPIPLSR